MSIAGVKLMHKRDSERIPVNLALRFPFSNTFIPGTVANLSEKGMFIDTELCFPLESKFEVLIKLEDGILTLPVQIVRIVKSDNKYTGMGVRILNSPQKYSEYLAGHSLYSRA
jgi:hypothetical protein